MEGGGRTRDWMHAEVEVCECLTSPGFDFYFRRIDPAGAPPLARRLSPASHLSFCKNNGLPCSRAAFFFFFFYAAAPLQNVRYMNELSLQGEMVGGWGWRVDVLCGVE